MITKQQIDNFSKEYKELCLKHGLFIDACCCAEINEIKEENNILYGLYYTMNNEQFYANQEYEKTNPPTN